MKHFTTLLGRMGYSVRAFMNYREAEGCLEYEYFDFVIVSQGSPAFETHDLVELTLARDRHTPVVVLTRCLEMKCYLEACNWAPWITSKSLWRRRVRTPGYDTLQTTAGRNLRRRIVKEEN